MKERYKYPTIPSGITRWDELPVELLENIFEHLEKRNDLLSLRAVSRHWNSVAGSILERRTLQLWTNWDPTKRWKDVTTFPKFKYILHGEYNNWNFLKNWFKKRQSKRWLSLFESKDVNPFPNRSLHIPTIHAAYPHLKLGVNSLLETFGQHLTSLQIDLLWSLTTSELHHVLRLVPNLKALTIKEFYDGINEKEGINSERLSSPNPSLTHLRVGHERPARPGNENPCIYIVRWLINLFAPQLVSLKLSGLTIYRFDESWCDGAFQRLKQLEITDFRYSQFYLENRLSLPCSLEHLSIVNLFDPVAANINELISCIDKFSGSLLTFHFQYFDDSSEGETPDTIRIIPIKMGTLDVYMSQLIFDIVSVRKSPNNPSED